MVGAAAPSHAKSSSRPTQVCAHNAHYFQAGGSSRHTEPVSTLCNIPDICICVAILCLRLGMSAGNAAHGIGGVGSQDRFAPHYGALLFAINAFSVWHCPNTASMYAEVCLRSLHHLPSMLWISHRCPCLPAENVLENILEGTTRAHAHGRTRFCIAECK